MIVFRDVSYAYEKDSPVLNGIGVELSEGLNLLLGPNGCGKSTLLKLASGVEKPDAGFVLVDGRDLWREEVEARQRIAYLPEFPDLTPYATLDEVVSLVCRMRGRPLEEGREALDFFGLRGASRHTVRELSLGQRRRAVFAAVFIGTPEHVLLDEPLAGMDRSIKPRILAWIQEQVDRGASVVVVSHDIEPFRDSAARLVTVRGGKALCFAELPRNPVEKLGLIDRIAQGGIPGDP
jgi:ABC-type multidrug transport system ATPase subunit